MKKKTKRMDDGGLAGRDDDMDRRDEMTERREQRKMGRDGMREERRSEMMKRRESRAAMTPEQRAAVRAQRMAKMREMGEGIKSRISGGLKGLGEMKMARPPMNAMPRTTGPLDMPKMLQDGASRLKGALMPNKPMVAPAPAVAPMAPKMKGGGLARKGVGQALKSGGMVRGCGAVKRGKTKGKMV